MRMIPAMLVALGVLATPAHSIEIAGPVDITDGDTFEIGGMVLRLNGIDAFENAQKCNRGGSPYPCGEEATNALRELTRNGVQCSGTEQGPYGRLLVHCTVNGRDLGEALVRTGYAFAFRKYSSEYIGIEEQARERRAGAWSGTFQPPWEYRDARWNSAVQAAPDAACPIKGNINRKGERIYHAPWSRWYGRTKINTANGERWFCNEAEAVAAGWRAPLR